MNIPEIISIFTEAEARTLPTPILTENAGHRTGTRGKPEPIEPQFYNSTKKAFHDALKGNLLTAHFTNSAVRYSHLPALAQGHVDALNCIRKYQKNETGIQLYVLYRTMSKYDPSKFNYVGALVDSTDTIYLLVSTADTYPCSTGGFAILTAFTLVDPVYEQAVRETINDIKQNGPTTHIPSTDIEQRITKTPMQSVADVLKPLKEKISANIRVMFAEISKDTPSVKAVTDAHNNLAQAFDQLRQSAKNPGGTHLEPMSEEKIAELIDKFKSFQKERRQLVNQLGYLTGQAKQSDNNNSTLSTQLQRARNKFDQVTASMRNLNKKLYGYTKPQTGISSRQPDNSIAMAQFQESVCKLAVMIPSQCDNLLAILESVANTSCGIV